MRIVASRETFRPAWTSVRDGQNTMAQLGFLVGMLLFVAWATMMGSYLYFLRHVAPSALRLWAEEHGYQIIKKQTPGPLAWWSFAKGSGHHIYRVVVLDEKGSTRGGLVRLGNPRWFCFSPARCPVEARWDPPEELARPIRPMTRRMVLGFAVADLVVVILLLAVGSALIFMAAVCLDEIWNGALGLNRRLGRVPRPGGRQDTPMALAQLLGLAALCLAAMVTLTAAGLGMIRRKRWGYYSHLVGSALVVLIPGGFLYGIPSLVITLQPAFREHFRGLEKPEPVPDLAEL